MPGCNVSGLYLNNHITAPHDNAAKTENTLASGGIDLAGVVTDALGLEGEAGNARGMKDATTREQTYKTIYDLVVLMLL